MTGIHAVVGDLKACAKQRDLNGGQQLHAFILKEGLLDTSMHISSTLICMYANCGKVSNAKQVFDAVPVPDVVSWTALITAYTQNEHAEEALDCFKKMQTLGISPNAITFACVLKACGSIHDVDKGSKVHTEITRQGFLDNDTVLGTALVDMYVKCGNLFKAQEAFNQLPVRNVFTWTCLMAGYAQQEPAEKVLFCFLCMQEESLIPNAVTFICILQACGSLEAVWNGKRIHVLIMEQNFIDSYVALQNSLAAMYAKCRAPILAEKVLNELSDRNVVSWNSIISGFCQDEEFMKAVNIFERMSQEACFPDVVTLTCILKACGGIGMTRKGKELHAQIIEQGLLAKDEVLGNSLVDFYAKCGEFSRARQEFSKLSSRSVVSWNAFMVRFAQHGYKHHALACFEQMQHEGLAPNTITLLCILQVCGSLGACEKGREIHTHIVREGLLEKDSILGVALVDMYAKCGECVNAHEVFDRLSFRHVVSWTALMAGYMQAGKGIAVFALYNKMLKEGIQPNEVTFTVVLSVCSHVGLVQKSQTYFAAVSANDGIAPASEHHTCMVSLLSRLGLFDKATGVARKLPPLNHLPIWLSLLSSCEKFGLVNLGRFAFEGAVCLP